MAMVLEGCWGPHSPHIHTPSRQQGDSGLLEAALCRTVSQDHLCHNHLRAGQTGWVSELDSRSAESLARWLKYKQKQMQKQKKQV